MICNDCEHARKWQVRLEVTGDDGYKYVDAQEPMHGCEVNGERYAADLGIRGKIERAYWPACGKCPAGRVVERKRRSPKATRRGEGKAA